MQLSCFSQGVDTTDTRQVSTKVPLAQVPYIMRALGFYPTEQEVCLHVWKPVIYLTNSRKIVKNFTFFSLHAFPFICKFFYYLLSFVSIISYLLYTQISVVIQRFTTSEDVCWNIRNVKISKAFYSFQKCVYISLCLSPRFAFCFFIGPC